jgi:hypothetical protein
MGRSRRRCCLPPLLLVQQHLLLLLIEQLRLLEHCCRLLLVLLLVLLVLGWARRLLHSAGCCSVPDRDTPHVCRRDVVTCAVVVGRRFTTAALTQLHHQQWKTKHVVHFSVACALHCM